MTPIAPTQRCECGAVEGAPPQKAESRQSGAESVTAAPLAFEPCVAALSARAAGKHEGQFVFARRCRSGPSGAPVIIRRTASLDRQDVVARHVLRAVDPLQHEHVQDVRILGLLVHSWKLRRETARASNAYFKSIELRQFGFRKSTRRIHRESARPKAAAQRLARTWAREYIPKSQGIIKAMVGRLVC